MCKTEQNTLYSSCTIAQFLNCYHLCVDSVLDKISHRPNTGSIIGGPYVEPLCWVCMKICNWTGIGWILRSFVRPPCSIFPGRSVQQLLPDLVLLKDCNFVFLGVHRAKVWDYNRRQSCSEVLVMLNIRFLLSIFPN